MATVSFVTSFLSVLAILSQALVILMITAKFFDKNKLSKKFLGLISKYALPLSFIVALIATLGSLFYSEIAGYEPCKLCWFQRILMYPQVIILGIAIWKKDKFVRNYIIPLAVLGILFSSYHYYLQLGGTPLTSCSVGNGASCAKRYTFNFGYITIPMMALSAFSLIFALMLASRKNDRIRH